MQSRNLIVYTLGFSAAVSIVCAVLVSTAAELLRDRQEANVEIDRQRNVLMAAGAVKNAARLSSEEIERHFTAFTVAAVDLRTGEEDPDFEITNYDARAALADQSTSRAAPSNNAQIQRIPNYVLVYKQLSDLEKVELIVLPIEGMGLWGTLYGFLALDSDFTTIQGLTYYEHKETPGLGGEVDNPKWQALWPDRKAFDAQGTPIIAVARGLAGTPQEDPHRVDGLSGATITSRGITNMLRFWLGEHGYGPYLKQLKEATNG